MKKILILLFACVFLHTIGLAQEPDTITSVKDSVISQTEFIDMDTLDFDPSEDSLNWLFSEWETINSGDTIIKIQYRINNQGIQQKRTIKMLRKNLTTVIHDYYSKLKEKKDKDKDKKLE